jgi:hypothetical protein
MSIFRELRNECLIRELCRELNTDLLLFGFDGFTYFGNLQNIEDGRVAILTPAVEAETDNVEILTPGGELIEVDFCRVDLWQIVGKGTGIVTDPLEEDKHHWDGAGAVGLQNVDPDFADRQPSRDLICQLERQIGDDVVLTTLGGFLFEGVLSEVEDGLAILTVDDIFVPGTSSGISSDRVRSAVVNLCALTSVCGASSC